MKVGSILLILLGLAAMGAGLASAPSHEPNPSKLAVVTMREVGAVPAGSAVPAPAEKPAPAPVAAPAPKAEPPPDRGNGKALEKALERTAEKPSDDLAVPEKPTAEKSRPPPPAEKAAPEKTADKAPPPAERAAPPPAPAKNTGAAKAPVADKGSSAGSNDDAAPAAAAPAAAGNGVLNLRASDTADVYVDGKKVGSSPLMGLKVKPGKHKVRFDCYLASGETKAGPTQSYDVGADAEKEVDYECPTE